METEKKTVPAVEEEIKEKKAKKSKEKKTLKQELLSWVWTLLAAFAIALVIRAFIAEPIRVDGGSMNNTLLNDEIVLVSKLDYLFGDIERGDVVICRYPGRMSTALNLGAALALDNHTLFVKRVVGIPGDTLFIAKGVLYVNGEPTENPEKMGSVPADMAPVKLGVDEYFVVGDNRRSSHDSRSGDVGPISGSAIMGKVKCVLMPFNAIRGVK